MVVVDVEPRQFVQLHGVYLVNVHVYLWIVEVYGLRNPEKRVRGAITCGMKERTSLRIPRNSPSPSRPLYPLRQECLLVVDCERERDFFCWSSGSSSKASRSAVHIVRALSVNCCGGQGCTASRGVRMSGNWDAMRRPC